MEEHRALDTMASWESLEDHQEYHLDDVAVDDLVEDWERLVSDADGKQEGVGDAVSTGDATESREADAGGARREGGAVRSRACVEEHASCAKVNVVHGCGQLGSDRNSSGSNRSRGGAAETQTSAKGAQHYIEHEPRCSTYQPPSSSVVHAAMDFPVHRVGGDVTTGAAVISSSPSAMGKEYMASLNEQSGLHIVAEQQVAKAYRDNGEYGLFSLFVTASFRRNILSWTSEEMVTRGQDALTESEFDAYCGLEIARSICVLSDIAEYWSEKRFLGQSAFPETMTRPDFNTFELH
ncbi:hypothetical protein DVH05_024435 [Phytophthora capsici]|nr:hypothetical protein DVH05_024435 [Phytophthora capsici]